MELFQSFFIGGFECADHINRSGDRIDLLHETAHDTRAAEDYDNLKRTGITTVREGICWSRVEKQPYMYDFMEVGARIIAAEQAGIQQIWDICHFGYPDDLVPTHPKFALRFASLCRAFATFYRKCTQKQLLVIPINEISFLSWHSGDVRGTVPFAVHSGFDIKYHLCKAAIKGIEALKEEDPGCRIILCEPLIWIHPRLESLPCSSIAQLNEDQFQAMDIIGGKICPELGGREEYLDILGFNYYHDCQWEHEGEKLNWETDSHRRASLSTLLQAAYSRYGRPMFLSETGHFGNGRAGWMEYIFKEYKDTRAKGINLLGICIYPVIDRPDWDNLQHYHNSGLWDIDPITKDRQINEPYLQALIKCLAETNAPAGMV
jgi:beta-glucosidase/6-phospho-beta-glucosidase/beta-galactosidase